MGNRFIDLFNLQAFSLPCSSMIIEIEKIFSVNVKLNLNILNIVFHYKWIYKRFVVTFNLIWVDVEFILRISKSFYL